MIQREYFYFFFLKVIDICRKADIIMGWVQIVGGQSSPGENREKPTMVLGRVAIGCPSCSSMPISLSRASANPSNRLEQGSTLDQGVTSPGCLRSFLRLAYYFGTVLSAVLTKSGYVKRGVRRFPDRLHQTHFSPGRSAQHFLTRLSWCEYPPQRY